MCSVVIVKFSQIVNFLITAKCIDLYTQSRVQAAENPTETVTIDDRLVAVVDKMFQRCFEDKKYKQVMKMIISSIVH